MTTHMGAARYERARTRRGHRNSHYTRGLVTTHGPLPKLHQLGHWGFPRSQFHDSYPKSRSLIASRSLGARNDTRAGLPWRGSRLC